MAFDRYNLDEAEKLVNEILKENINYNDAKILLARILASRQKYTDAIAQLTEVLWSEPNSSEALLLSGQLYQAAGDPKKADKQFAELVQINPANIQAILFAYDKAVRKKDYSYAKSLVEKGLAYNPGNFLLLEKLVAVNIYNKNWEQAKAVIQSISANASYLAKDLAKFLTGDLYEAQGDFAKAISVFKEMASQFPDNQDVLKKLIYNFDQLSQTSEAIRFLNELFEKNPGSVNLGLQLGELYKVNKQFDKASQLVNRLLEKSNAPQLYLFSSKLKILQNNTLDAIKTYQEGLKANPGDQELIIGLASAYEIKGNFDQAIAEYEALLAKNPYNDMAINNLASILIEHFQDKEKIQRAVDLAQKFKDYDNPYYRDTYAWSLLKLGNLSEGVNQLKQIVSSNPDTSVFRYHLGYGYYKSNNPNAAITELKQAIQLSNKNGFFTDKNNAEALLNSLEKK